MSHIHTQRTLTRGAPALRKSPLWFTKSRNQSDDFWPYREKKMILARSSTIFKCKQTVLISFKTWNCGAAFDLTDNEAGVDLRLERHEN
jgi:hypothetical protein